MRGGGNLLERASGLVYPLVVAGILLGFAWSGLGWLAERAGQVETWIPAEAAVAAGLFALALAARLLERLVPLRALPELRWVYHGRPRRRLRGVDRSSLAQLAVFTAAGFAVGLATGIPLIAAVVALTARALPLVNGPRRLPGLLAAGRTRLVGTGAWAVQDSELVSDALAASWLRWRPAPPTDHLPRLFLRRLRRRSYLPVTAAVIVAAAVALAGTVDTVLVVVGFVLAWSVLGAGLYRCADFSRLGRVSWLWLPVLLVHGLVAAGIVGIVWGMTNPAVTVPLVMAAVVTTGFLRGRPRRVTQLTMVDSGFGVTAPPELVGYYLAGLPWGAVLAVLAVLAAFGI